MKQNTGIRWLRRNLRHLRKFSARILRDLWAPDQGSILEIVDNYCKRNSSITFVQIGANTGDDQFRDLRMRYHWRGVMAEPQKDVFETLVSRNSQQEGVSFSNVAISDSDTTKHLYKPTFSTAEWATALATFDKHVIEKHISNGWIQKQARESGISLPENVADYFMVEDVQCVTLSRLLSQHKISAIDLLIIDTEGQDFEIIQQIDFRAMLPSIIVFEHKHLLPVAYKKCVRLLRKNGYHLFTEGPDTLALTLKPVSN